MRWLAIVWGVVADRRGCGGFRAPPWPARTADAMVTLGPRARNGHGIASCCKKMLYDSSDALARGVVGELRSDLPMPWSLGCRQPGGTRSGSAVRVRGGSNRWAVSRCPRPGVAAETLSSCRALVSTRVAVWSTQGRRQDRLGWPVGVCGCAVGPVARLARSRLCARSAPSRAVQVWRPSPRLFQAGQQSYFAPAREALSNAESARSRISGGSAPARLDTGISQST